MLLSPLKSIREKCLDCCCGSTHEVKPCSVEKCPLHPYRFGKNPGYNMTPARKAALENARLRRESLAQRDVLETKLTPEYKDIPEDVLSENAAV